MELTNDQSNVFDQVMKRLGGGNSFSQFNPDFDYITIGGYAGTGKTFLISVLRKEIKNRYEHKKIAFVSFTGKASSVLSKKLREDNCIFLNDYCGTIHSLIYIPDVKYDSKVHAMVVVGWKKRESLLNDFDLIIIDEASMINKDIWIDLLDYKIPIIAIGDHGQLPPIGDNFNLMSNPQYTLTEIKRQSLENPLIRLSQEIRMGKGIPFGFYDKNNKNVFKLNSKSDECKTLLNKIDFNDENLIVLCWKNKTRVKLNQIIRSKLNFFEQVPYPGERVICLKNNHTKRIMNGMLGTVIFLIQDSKNVYNMDIKFDGISDYYNGKVHKDCFGKTDYSTEFVKYSNYGSGGQRFRKKKSKEFNDVDFFDFGYCISVHKSQGSEWDKVILIEERGFYQDDDYYKRWLYTGVTRAKEKLFVISI